MKPTLSAHSSRGAAQLERLVNLSSPEFRVDKHVFMAAMGVGESLFNEARRTDPDFPKPVLQLHRLTRWRFGDVEDYLAVLNQKAKAQQLAAPSNEIEED